MNLPKIISKIRIVLLWKKTKAKQSENQMGTRIFFIIHQRSLFKSSFNINLYQDCFWKRSSCIAGRKRVFKNSNTKWSFVFALWLLKSRLHRPRIWFDKYLKSINRTKAMYSRITLLRRKGRLEISTCFRLFLYDKAVL